MTRKLAEGLVSVLGVRGSFPILANRKKMGCHKLPYYEKEDLNFFQGLWKKSDGSKNCDNYYAFGLVFNSYSRENSTPNDYKYNGKEEQTELGLNWLDYGWRMYDPTIARWNGIDGMSEKYVSSSPYHYAGNNPVRNYDIDGNEFTEAGKKWAKRLWDNISGQISKNNNKIAKKNEMLATGYNSKGKALSSNKMERLERQVGNLQAKNAELTQVASEVIAMDNSDQLYNVIEADGFKGSGDTPDKAAAMFNLHTGAVDIILPGSSTSNLNLLAHEFKHAYQFETGTASLTTYPGGNNSTYRTISPLDWLAYDQQDELEAYRRQGLFGSTHSSLPSGYNNRSVGGVSFPKNQVTMQPYSNSSHADLQRIADNARQAFRLNGTTYAPKR
jgi:RHS repeat-associated protein